MKNQIRLIARQGDIGFIPVNAIPNNATAKKNEIPGRLILAHGEVTGHHHSLVDEAKSTLFYDPDNKDNSYLRVVGKYHRFDTENEARGFSLKHTGFLRAPIKDPYTQRITGWAVAERSCAVEHQEHGVVLLPPQDYFVLRQVEWTDEQEPIAVSD